MGKLNPIEIKFWLSEAQSCELRWKKEVFQRNNYPFLVNYYEGFDKVDAREMSPHVATERRLSIINEYFPNTNSLISQIMYQNPDIIVEATKAQAEKGEAVMKSALTYGFEKADALMENRVALFDMFYAGYCAVEVDHIKEEDEMDLLPSDEELGKRKGLIERVKDKFRKPKDDEQAELNMAKEAATKEDPYMTNERTYVRRWEPSLVPLDWRADRNKDRRYNLKKVWYSKAEFDAKYPEFTKKVMPVDKDTSFMFSTHDSLMHSRKVLLYEFQVRQKNNKYKNIVITPSLLTEEIDLFPRPYATNGFNMKIGTLHNYGKVYPIAVAQVNKVMNDELNEYVRFMKKVAEKNIPKRAVNTDKVKTDGINALNDDVINQVIPIKGTTAGAIENIAHTSVSIENKEFLGLAQEQKNKLWSVSESRVGGRATPKFAEELKIQEAGFQGKQIDIQEGLRRLIREELETIKDIIAVFWDFPVFFKITGGEKPSWYEPELIPDANNPERQIVTNPLSNLLTGDYFVKVDISSALRPNKERLRAETLEFIKLLMTPGSFQFMQLSGKALNFDEVAKSAKDFGFHPEALFIDAPVTAAPVPVSTGAAGAPAPGVV